MKNCYRVIEDRFAGYEAQVKFWWFPFVWFQMIEKGYLSNTWRSLDEAKDFITYGSKNKTKSKKQVYWISNGCK